MTTDCLNVIRANIGTQLLNLYRTNHLRLPFGMESDQITVIIGRPPDVRTVSCLQIIQRRTCSPTCRSWGVFVVAGNMKINNTLLVVHEIFLSYLKIVFTVRSMSKIEGHYFTVTNESHVSLPAAGGAIKSCQWNYVKIQWRGKHLGPSPMKIHD